MLDGPAVETAPPAARWPFAFIGIGGLLGAAGVAVGAAGAHLGGGDLAHTASEFLLVHAAALVAGAGAARSAARGGRALAVGMGLLAVGAASFGGELALAGLYDWRPVPLAAPAGGLCLIAGWLTVSAAGLVDGLRRR